jgi:hypothetical protein
MKTLLIILEIIVSCLTGYAGFQINIIIGFGASIFMFVGYVYLNYILFIKNSENAKKTK